MQSGRILPVVRQFFGSLQPTNTHRDRDSGKNQQGFQERETSEEEAKEAASILAGSEEFIHNSLSVECLLEGGRPALLVRDRSGNLLRTIRGFEIFRVLLSHSTPDAPRQGRILDRRI